MKGKKEMKYNQTDKQSKHEGSDWIRNGRKEIEKKTRKD